jgi:hypothetical protein
MPRGGGAHVTCGTRADVGASYEHAAQPSNGGGGRHAHRATKSHSAASPCASGGGNSVDTPAMRLSAGPPGCGGCWEGGAPGASSDEAPPGSSPDAARARSACCVVGTPSGNVARRWCRRCNCLSEVCTACHVACGRLHPSAVARHLILRLRRRTARCRHRFEQNQMAAHWSPHLSVHRRQRGGHQRGQGGEGAPLRRHPPQLAGPQLVRHYGTCRMHFSRSA